MDYLHKVDQIFDVLICSHIIEHLSKPSEFLLGFKKYCKRIYIEVPDFDNSFINIIRQIIGLTPYFNDPEHVYEFSREEIEDIIIKADMRILDCEFRYGVMRYWVET